MAEIMKMNTACDGSSLIFSEDSRLKKVHNCIRNTLKITDHVCLDNPLDGKQFVQL